MDEAKTRARAAGVTVVDLSIGASDLPPPPEALEALKAATEWYGTRYGMQLDPATEALSLIGAQEGLAHALMAVADPGDGILMTDVAYPSYFGAGAQDFLPRLDQLGAADLARARVMLLNYPNNPTSAVATTEFFQAAVDLCRKYGILLIHDNPYIDLCVLELFSFAKSYHLGGFRLGFALGCREAVASLEALKAPIDFNQYKGIMRMGVACLKLPREVVRRDAGVWQRRAEVMAGALRGKGCEVQMPTAGMYLWIRLPPGVDDDVAFCQHLVSYTGVALSPGQGFGPGGRGYVRVALVAREEALEEAAGRIAAAMRQAEQEARAKAAAVSGHFPASNADVAA
ncbi:aspartate aminotransferase [Volvox carteri f. nagariensis]|uniref:Aspartate aminotransferase n=1 Tax=Volvox carteri f. nagariensis TaxID=3068 RepID=D8TIN8_VOLCA|nr:aspartate aminotransferase [Volvox carteri f. nagariensis]EFJ53276.1 aspartate aminotransferase [Volvox carteri f. nagariensis]|eukprot:XP_002946281.1 aspartate aminotransferase [Volvox carteri f. nagariensis]